MLWFWRRPWSGWVWVKGYLKLWHVLTQGNYVTWFENESTFDVTGGHVSCQRLLQILLYFCLQAVIRLALLMEIRYYLWQKYIHPHWKDIADLGLRAADTEMTTAHSICRPSDLISQTAPGSKGRESGYEPCQISVDERLLLDNVWLQKHLGRMGVRLVKQQKIRDCCAHIFTETCLHHYVTGPQDEMRCLHRWCLVLIAVKVDGKCLPDVERVFFLDWLHQELIYQLALLVVILSYCWSDRLLWSTVTGKQFIKSPAKYFSKRACLFPNRCVCTTSHQ